MHHKLIKLIFSAALLGASVQGLAGESHGWGYSGENGPEHWDKLNPDYKLCGSGKNQSPVNLTDLIEADLAPIQFIYTTEATEILNNGHTVQANFAPGSTLRVNGREFELKQIHFHAPSENQIDGASFAMEGHLVHADKDGNLAVVAVMYREGRENHAIAKLWQQMPSKAGDKTLLLAQLKANELLPDNRDYYRFNGSLTTPPCSEGVTWLVMKYPVTATAHQVEQFAHTMHHPNNRPVQASFARPILK